MVQATPFLLTVLFLTLGAHSFSVKKCSLTGLWTNDLGSNMTIGNMNPSGDFTGIYCTAVSVSPVEIKESPLLGSQRLPDDQNPQPTFGFTVHWVFSDSITVFMGQCFVDDDGKEILKTMWLLRSHTDKCRDWKATRVGYKEFMCPE